MESRSLWHLPVHRAALVTRTAGSLRTASRAPSLQSPCPQHSDQPWSLHSASCWPFTPLMLNAQTLQPHLLITGAWSPPVHDTSHITSVDMPSERGVQISGRKLCSPLGKSPQVSAPFPLLWTSANHTRKGDGHIQFHSQSLRREWT